jgi:hypothetical protein
MAGRSRQITRPPPRRCPARPAAAARRDGLTGPAVGRSIRRSCTGFRRLVEQPRPARVGRSLASAGDLRQHGIGAGSASTARHRGPAPPRSPAPRRPRQAPRRSPRRGRRPFRRAGSGAGQHARAGTSAGAISAATGTGKPSPRKARSPRAGGIVALRHGRHQPRHHLRGLRGRTAPGPAAGGARRRQRQPASRRDRSAQRRKGTSRSIRKVRSGPAPRAAKPSNAATISGALGQAARPARRAGPRPGDQRQPPVISAPSASGSCGRMSTG